jgi:hypothetical protein
LNSRLSRLNDLLGLVVKTWVLAHVIRLCPLVIRRLHLLRRADLVPSFRPLLSLLLSHELFELLVVLSFVKLDCDLFELKWGVVILSVIIIKIVIFSFSSRLNGEKILIPSIVAYNFAMLPLG